MNFQSFQKAFFSPFPNVFFSSPEPTFLFVSLFASPGEGYKVTVIMNF
jgi:hypothetical protein